MSLSPWEIMVIAVAALLIFGPRKLPELARTAGRALQEFRRATRDLTQDLRMELDDETPFPQSRPRSEGLRASRPDDAPSAGEAQPPTEELRPGPRA